MKRIYIGETPIEPIPTKDLEDLEQMASEKCLTCGGLSDYWGIARFERLSCGTINGDLLPYGLCENCLNAGYTAREITQRATREFMEKMMIAGDIARDIPREMRDMERWLGWKKVPRAQKDGTTRIGKVPVDPMTGRLLASWQQPKSWMSFENAVWHLDAGRIEGIGFVFADGCGLVAIDLDKARLPNGCPKPWADEILGKLLPTYVEYSPSLSGYHIIVAGSLPQVTKVKKALGTGEGVEIFASSGFVTITGKPFQGYTKIQSQQDGLDWLMKKYFDGPAKLGRQTQPLSAGHLNQSETDARILEKVLRSKVAARFAALYQRGDLTPYKGDHSAADMALCCLLAYWCDGDAVQMDRLFRTSALYRAKWDRAVDAAGTTYGQLTVQRARERAEK